MLCFHQWEVKSKKITKSVFEQMTAQGFRTNSACAKDFEKELVVMFKCKKCGLFKQKIFHSEAIIE